MKVIDSEGYKRRSIGLEYIKSIACVCVVILHSVGNGGGTDKLRLFVYFWGTFGIPLFFMANGYAMGDKELSNEYLFKKMKGYTSFVARWYIIIAVPVLLLTQNLRNILSLAKGIISGSGYLFALWFMPALCLIYLLIALRNLIKGKPFRYFGGLNCIIVAVILLFADYLTNRILFQATGNEIRNMLWPPFRVFVSFGYFFIGMKIKHLLSHRMLSHKQEIIAVICMISGLVFLAITANTSNIIWASSFYGSPLIVAACISIFVLCIGFEDRLNRNILLFSTQTTGIWVIHPFIIRIYNKFFAMFLPGSPPNSVLFLVSRFFAVLVISFLISCVLHKFKVSSRLVDVSPIKMK